MCILNCTRLFKKAHAAFGQERGFERGEGGGGGEFPSPLTAFLSYIIDIFTTY